MSSRRRQIMLIIALFGFLGAGLYFHFRPADLPEPIEPRISKPHTPPHGEVIKVENVEIFPAEQVLVTSRRNYAATAPMPRFAVRKAVIQYSSLDEKNNRISVYARAYLPTSGTSRPILAFAPGTTGIGDQCAASLEQPLVHNWADYDSHMLTYAGQGYATIITDYEGMRDPSRMHHYMVGELEGRAVLDSIRALLGWQEAKSRVDAGKIVVGGFSQGGHSAMWADKLAGAYTPELHLKGVVGFGPVSDVKRTLADITRGANINWFGPFVLSSYANFYKTDYGLDKILLPDRAANLDNNVSATCIEALIPRWGRTQGLYTPQFIQALATDSLSKAGYGKLEDDLKKNSVGDQPTQSAKLFNQGAHDNVILPGQQAAMQPTWCRSSKGPVALKIYPQATHYNIMVQSLQDTMRWMDAVHRGDTLTSSCRR